MRVVREFGEPAMLWNRGLSFAISIAATIGVAAVAEHRGCWNLAAKGKSWSLSEMDSTFLRITSTRLLLPICEGLPIELAFPSVRMSIARL